MSVAFSDVVGQQEAKDALIALAICPALGGVLLRGEKGTAKSTLARGLAGLLQDGARLVNLPLGATEDRVLGGIDLERTLAEGRPRLAPGLLTDADGGVLYVDEVNLLADHVVDVVLDAASSGECRVEREGLSAAVPSRFALVGSMNPEEGELRPHLLDRFGLCIDVVGERDLAHRVTIIQRCLGLETADSTETPGGTTGMARPQESRPAAAPGIPDDPMAERLRIARELFPHVRVRPELSAWIAEICRHAHVAGHRADVVLRDAARAWAAWHGRRRVEVGDVEHFRDAVLTHRRRTEDPPPPPEPPPPDTPPDSDGAPPDSEQPEPNQHDTEPNQHDTEPNTDDAESNADDTEPERSGEPPDDVARVGATFTPRRIEPPKDRLARTGSGRRHLTRTADRRGRYMRARRTTSAADLAVDATLRAAAVHQRRRRAPGQHGVVVRPDDWHAKVRQRRIGAFVVFVVDASGSMGARGRMVASKGAVMSLLTDAYQKRDRISLLAFRRQSAEVLLPPTSSVLVAQHLLADMATGGRTPLMAGLTRAHQLVSSAMLREPNTRPLVIVVSDGRANAPEQQGADPHTEVLAAAERLGADNRVRWVVVDAEDPRGVRLHRAGALAGALRAEYFTLEDLARPSFVDRLKGM